MAGKLSPNMLPQPKNAPHPHGGHPHAGNTPAPTSPSPPVGGGVGSPKSPITPNVPTPTPPTQPSKPGPLVPIGGSPIPQRRTPILYTDNSNGADLVFIFGVGLIVVNEISSGRIQRAWGLAWNGKYASGKNVKQDFMIIGGEMLFIVILTIIAQTNRDVKNFILTFIIALWIVWTVINAKKIGGWSDKFVAADKGTQTTTTATTKGAAK